MDSTKTLLERLRAKHGDCSDYRLAKILAVTATAVSRYMQGRNGMAYEVGLRVAAELELPPEYVLLCLAAEREQSEAIKPIWRELVTRAAGQTARPAPTRRRVAKVAAVLLGAGITAFCSVAPQPASAGAATSFVYYGKSRGHRRTATPHRFPARFRPRRARRFAHPGLLPITAQK